MEFTSYPDGAVSWVDLATTDVAGAKRFYAGLFGWTFSDLPIDSGGVYSMAEIEGKQVTGLGQLPPEMQQQGVPPMWTAYVNHHSIDLVVERTGEAGGSVLMPPLDVMDSGRMTNIQDPTGAAIGVWQPKQHKGAQLQHVPGALTWAELQTKDVPAAKKFYHAVFDWDYEVDANDYVLAKKGDNALAGMMEIQEDWGETPPNWTVYFQSGDVEASVVKVKELGGSVLVPPMPAGELGKFAVAQDPQGAVFSILEYKAAPDGSAG
ncbi:MAG: VOC family protein [Candidatus Promineifilaceae bacterium]